MHLAVCFWSMWFIHLCLCLINFPSTDGCYLPQPPERQTEGLFACGTLIICKVSEADKSHDFQKEFFLFALVRKSPFRKAVWREMKTSQPDSAKRISCMSRSFILFHLVSTVGKQENAIDVLIVNLDCVFIRRPWFICAGGGRSLAL